MPVNYDVMLRTVYLQAAQAAIQEEEDAIQRYRDLYNGEHGVLLTTRQKEYLTANFDTFANVCRRVVHITADRLRIAEDGISATGQAGQAYAEEALKWWGDTTEDDGQNDVDCFSLQPDIYNAAMRDGVCALVVGWDEERQRPKFTPNLLYDGETGLIRFHYDSDNVLLFASKRWTAQNPLRPDINGQRRLIVYTPGYIERFKSTASSWQPLTLEEMDGLPNPQPWTTTGDFGGEPLGIPVIPFENPNGSELQDVDVIQQMINHNLGAFDRGIDFHGFPLLWGTGMSTLPDANGEKTVPEFGPQMFIEIADPAGSVGRIEPADLTKLFESGVMSWVQILALVKGWPMWLFDRNQQPPSGVALQQMERSLVEQIRAKQTAFSGAWRQAFNMGRKLYELRTGKALPGQIVFEWQDAESVDELAHFEALEKKFTAAEVPIIQRWLEVGYTLDEVETLLAYKRREDEFGLADFVTGINQ